MPQFSWLTFAQSKAALAQRLQDPGKVFWVDVELGLYIIEALRTWNALTSIWNDDYALNISTPVASNWYDLAFTAGYPRQRTVTDAEIFRIICYHLIEPPNIALGGYGINYGFNYGLGSTPAGTGQFTIAMMSAALQRRRDEIIQLTACLIENIQPAVTPNIRRVNLPDTVLECIRNRYVPVDDQDPAATLWRDDELAFSYFESDFLQDVAKPDAYSVITGPPLGIDLNTTPPSPAVLDLIALKSGAVLNPPFNTIFGLPNDWCWLAKWAAMSDLLNMESEATDIPRAKYCLERYKDGAKLMAAMPWLLMGTMNGVAVDTVSVTEMDQYAAEWDSDPNAPECVVTAGTDFVAASPIPSVDVGVGLKVVANAPVPIDDSDFVQVSRDTYDVILDYAQHLAQFKQGGAEFGDSMELLANFVKRAASENSRISELGLYRDILLQEGNREEEVQPRFSEED